MRVSIRNKWWRIVRKKLRKKWGYCYYKRRELVIDKHLRGLKLVDIAVHEVLHAEFPKLGEKDVTRAATEIAAVLDVMGVLKPR